MTEQKLCPQCGNPLPPHAPQGICPSCVAKANLGTGLTGWQSGSSGRPPPMPVEEVARLFPEMEIMALLGAGGMGAVYKARQLKLNRMIALKILHRDERDLRFVERFTREAQTLARLNHPNIVAVHEFGERDGLFFLIMELVDGVTLRDLLSGGKLGIAELHSAHGKPSATRSPMRPEQALAIVPPICEALQYAHEKGVVHRDIKPENILLDKEGRVKVADFGIARLAGVDRVESLTGEGQVVGTAHYMAPEQVERPAEVDHRADIYALGVVFYEMLTGELPLGRFSNPSKKVQIDVRLDEVVLKALEKEPAQRYQQASEVRTRVERITREEELGPAETRAARTSRVGGVPWQVWVAVGFLAVEGLGNLISGFNILNQPMALVWLGAKTLLVTGLLLGWRLMFVLALILAGHHVIQFAPVHPVAAVLNAVLFGLIGWSWRFFFSTDVSAAEGPVGRRTRWPVRWAIAAMVVMFGTGLIALVSLTALNHEIRATVQDAATGEPIAGAHVNIWSPGFPSGSIINRTPRSGTDGRLRIILPRKLIRSGFGATVQVHALWYEPGSWDFAAVKRDDADGEVVFELHRERAQEKEAAAPGDYKVTFVNGVTYEVVAIARDPRNSDLWWAPDGTPLRKGTVEVVSGLEEEQGFLDWLGRRPSEDAASRRFGAAPSSANTPENEVLIYIRLIYPPGWPDDLYSRQFEWIPRPSESGGSARIRLRGSGEEMGWADLLWFMEVPDSLDLKVTLPMGPWEPVAIYDGRDVRELVDGVKAAFRAPGPDDHNDLALEIRHSVDFKEHKLRLMARFHDGSTRQIFVHSTDRHAADDLTTHVLFSGNHNFRLADVKEIELARTPLATGEFRGIQLKPRMTGQAMDSGDQEAPPASETGTQGIDLHSEIELVLQNFGYPGRITRGLNLDTGRFVEIPEGNHRPIDLTNLGIDMTAIGNDAGEWGLLTSAKLASLEKEAWLETNFNSGHLALFSGHMDLELEGSEFGWGGYNLSQGQVSLPIIMAFQTVQGSRGMLKIVEFTTEPAGIRVQVKLARSSAGGE